MDEACLKSKPNLALGTALGTKKYLGSWLTKACTFCHLSPWWMLFWSPDHLQFDIHWHSWELHYTGRRVGMENEHIPASSLRHLTILRSLKLRWYPLERPGSYRHGLQSRPVWHKFHRCRKLWLAIVLLNLHVKMYLNLRTMIFCFLQISAIASSSSLW